MDDLVEFKERYLNGVAQKFGTLECFTDKMPHNFLYVPLILKCFSKCKIIHVKRDPIATCFSNFKQYFSEGLGYSCDLENLKTYYLLYEKLMQEWELYYPSRIYSVKYEDFVTEPDISIKELINHLDLPWDPDCLSPEKNKRSVRTASQTQVRKKVYKGSSKAWKKYEPFLKGAFDVLDR